MLTGSLSSETGFCFRDYASQDQEQAVTSTEQFTIQEIQCFIFQIFSIAGVNSFRSRHHAVTHRQLAH
jgi:hypothetical protein